MLFGRISESLLGAEPRSCPRPRRLRRAPHISRARAAASRRIHPVIAAKISRIPRGLKAPLFVRSSWMPCLIQLNNKFDKNAMLRNSGQPSRAGRCLYLIPWRSSAPIPHISTTFRASRRQKLLNVISAAFVSNGRLLASRTVMSIIPIWDARIVWHFISGNPFSFDY